jgi:hypothetical protein
MGYVTHLCLCSLMQLLHGCCARKTVFLCVHVSISSTLMHTFNILYLCFLLIFVHDFEFPTITPTLLQIQDQASYILIMPCQMFVLRLLGFVVQYVNLMSSLYMQWNNTIRSQRVVYWIIHLPMTWIFIDDGFELWTLPKLRRKKSKNTYLKTTK